MTMASSARARAAGPRRRGVDVLVLGLATGWLATACGLFKAAPAPTAPATENPAFFRGLTPRAAPPTPENPAFFQGLSTPQATGGPVIPEAAPGATVVTAPIDDPPPVVPPADRLRAVLDQTPWDYAASALTVDIDSDPKINTFAGEAHSLVLSVVQTADAGAFHQLLATPGQFSQVLQGAPPASGLLAVDRYAIEPGRQVRVVADRMQGARFVGVVAAYYGVSPAATGRLFAIPVRFTSTGLILKDYRATPVPALLRLKLGPAVILDATLDAVDPRPPVPGPGAVAVPTTAAAIPFGTPDALQDTP